MIAIGGAIGVGLFLGSGVTIELAGPGVIVTYLLGALIAMVVAYSLAEMAVVHPVSGSFGIYAEKYLSPWAGFCVRGTYGLVQIIAIGAEVTAVAIYFAFWFAMIKVVAILGFIAVGLALITGLGPGHAIGLANLTQNGGFFPHGLRGVWLALTLAITSYMGVEVIAVTAGEAQEPTKSIPRAMRTIVFRLIVFYVFAVAIMLAMTPWNRTGSASLGGSPFVRAFATAGIPYAASIMNLVVITAALSSANTNLYLSTRMLFSLSRGEYAPASLSQLSSNGVPHRALAISAGGMVAAILLAIFAPKNAFLLLYGTAVAGMFFVWIVILLTHLCFRKSIGRQTLEALPLRLRAHPLPTLASIAAIAAIALSTIWVDGLRYTLPTFAPCLLIMSVVYVKYRIRYKTNRA